MSTTIVKASGLTCQHCVMSLTEELMELEAVTDLTVDLVPEGPSTVTIQHQGELKRSDIAAAIAEAGYTLLEEH